MTFAEAQELEQFIGERLAGSEALSSLIGDRLYRPPFRELASNTASCVYYSVTEVHRLMDQAGLFIGCYAPSLTEAEEVIRIVDRVVLACCQNNHITDVILTDQRTEGRLVGIPGIGQTWVYQITYRYLLEWKVPAKPENGIANVGTK